MVQPYVSGSVGVGYEFSDWGKSQLGRAPGQTINSGLALSHFYTNAFQPNVTYSVYSISLNAGETMSGVFFVPGSNVGVQPKTACVKLSVNEFWNYTYNFSAERLAMILKSASKQSSLNIYN